MDTAKILQELEEYKLPSNEVPLSALRYPFKGLKENTMHFCIGWALQYPEKIGRLTKSINSVLQRNILFPEEYALKEIHIDLANVDETLFNDLTALGFEPDNFIKLHPEEYTFCFTMEFCIELGNTKRIKEIHDFMLQQYEKAIDLINNSKAYGYIEMESYSSKYVREYSFVPLCETALDNMPFNEESFDIFYLPNTDTEAKSLSIDLYTHKKADIHIKTPTSQKGEAYKLADSKSMRKFRGLLIKAGFYEIISEGGNYIYTAQLLDGNQAKTLFADIVTFAETFGGITGIKYEICTAFWRKDIGTREDKVFLCEIPNLVSYKKDWNDLTFIFNSI